MLEYEPERIKEYLNKLEKLGIILDLDDVMGISCENEESIIFTVDGELEIKKEKKKVKEVS